MRFCTLQSIICKLPDNHREFYVKIFEGIKYFNLLHQPPYGVRAGAKKIGKKPNTEPITNYLKEYDFYININENKKSVNTINIKNNISNKFNDQNEN